MGSSLFDPNFYLKCTTKCPSRVFSSWSSRKACTKSTVWCRHRGDPPWRTLCPEHCSHSLRVTTRFSSSSQNFTIFLQHLRCCRLTAAFRMAAFFHSRRKGFHSSRSSLSFLFRSSELNFHVKVSFRTDELFVHLKNSRPLYVKQPLSTHLLWKPRVQHTQTYFLACSNDTVGFFCE